MADVRALLRQQRAARRIEHPHASYTESGKLLCTVCREPVRGEPGPWEAHLRSDGHRHQLLRLQQARKGVETPSENGAPQVPEHRTAHKRKHGESSDEDMTSNDEQQTYTDDGGDEEDESLPRKRSRHDMSEGKRSGSTSEAPATPVSRPASSRPTSLLSRRQSTTPSQGIELNIPSRPATPSSTSTPSQTPRSGGNATQSLGRSPLIPQGIPQGETRASASPVPGTVAASAAAGTSSTLRSTAETVAAGSTNGAQLVAPPDRPDAGPTPQGAAQVDEDEWTRFEAEIAAELAASEQPELSADAVIIAAPQTAEQIAAPEAEEQAAAEAKGEQPRTRAQVEIAAEQEDAARAMEEEFDVMEDLEARVRRLKERREALRSGASAGPASEIDVSAKGAGLGITQPAPEGTTENAAVDGSLALTAPNDEESGEDEDDEDEDDEWSAFRLHR